MTSRLRSFSTAAILVLLGSAPAKATTLVICNQVTLSGNDFVSCEQGAVDEYTDPVSGAVDVIGTAQASADLRTGSLRSSSVSQSLTFESHDLAVGSNSGARLQDTITIGGGYSGAVVVHMSVSGGFLSTDPTAPIGIARMGAYFQVYDAGGVDLGSASAFVDAINNSGNPFLVGIHDAYATGYTANESNANPATGYFADPEDVRLDFTTSFLVTPSTPTFTLFANLSTVAQPCSVAFPCRSNLAGDVVTTQVNFGNTAYLSLSLPEGVSWTSESGAFLTAVPEPGTAMLSAIGLFGLGAGRRTGRASWIRE